MQLPILLQQSIENITAFCSLKKLSDASLQLTDRYRNPVKEGKYVNNDMDYLAYIVARMPATYAVIFRVLQELMHRFPAWVPSSCLDLGSGPGTGLWAAIENFPSMHDLYAWEFDSAFIQLGQELARSHNTLSRISWSHKDYTQDRNYPSVDLGILSYSVGEIPEERFSDFFKNIWQKINHSLVIIEPGTPAGYHRILKIRELLLKENANLIAPCPHHLSCPLLKEDWCHFYARLERSSIHRKIKHASLNYEDEKFSYLIFSKEKNTSLYSGRILRFPNIQKGFVQISVCSQEGVLQNKTISKKNKDDFKSIKKKDWGDSI